jgi:hypothetical protein
MSNNVVESESEFMFFNRPQKYGVAKTLGSCRQEATAAMPLVAIRNWGGMAHAFTLVKKASMIMLSLLQKVTIPSPSSMPSHIGDILLSIGKLPAIDWVQVQVQVQVQ